MTPDELKAATQAPEHRGAEQTPVDHYETRAEESAAAAAPDSSECNCPICQIERGEDKAQMIPIPLSIVVNILTEICTKENERWDHDPATGAKLDRNFGEMIALAHGELSEALEGHRKDLDDPHVAGFKNVDIELADAVIRICHLAGNKGIDLGAALVAKLKYNRTRADHTNEARMATGGKKY